MRKFMNNKGFTLVELLAVVVILGLLLAVAIPGVSKYIESSRLNTLNSTVEGYISATIMEVNSLGYSFYAENTVYAIPIECVSLEKGGEDPFGEWMQANNEYWAYVLVQRNSDSTYTYGFTFKDSAGMGCIQRV